MRSTKNLEGSKKSRVLIVDDHPLLRAGLAIIINQQDDMVVCGEAEDEIGAMQTLIQQAPDLVIADISLGRGSGLDLIKTISVRTPELPVVALSVHPESLYAERAIRAGAMGYVMKSEPIDVLLAALRKALRGHVALSEDMTNRLLTQYARGKTGGATPAEVLTNRQLEVFRLLGQGLGTKKIALRLGVGVSTVETYRSAIKEKLGLLNATELIAEAVRYVALENEVQKAP